MNIITAQICTALNSTGVIGSKVTDQEGFLQELYKAAADHDFDKDRVSGQGFIQLPGALPYVSAGVGVHRPDSDSYVLRHYRGRVSAYLKRAYAAPVESCAAVVYTRKAYFEDPDATNQENARIMRIEMETQEVTHILVAVLASAGPASQLSPYRFTANLAGANFEAQVWTADEIRAKARAIIEQDNQWATVADPE